MLSQTSIPEVKEDVIGYALHQRRARVGQFQDLGPPDLITLIKSLPSSSSTTTATASANDNGATSNINGQDPTTIVTELHSHDKLKGQIGTFFYCMGIDTSDPTSITIFAKKITDLFLDTPQIWFGKKKHFHVSKISISSWNAFRKYDVNIIVHIPGTVQTYIINSDGEQSQLPSVAEASSGRNSQDLNVNMIWAETFMSGIVRDIMIMKDNRADGESQNLVETLIFNPLTSGELEDVANNFIKLFPLVYEKGVYLDAPTHVLNPSLTNNYLVETLVEIVRLTKSLEACRKMLKKLIEIHPEAVIILIRVYFACDLEIDAVDLINEQLNSPSSFLADDSKTSHIQLIFKSELLSIQSEFLLDVKRDYKLAKEVAMEAVNCAPNEFKTWYLLTRIYIKLNDMSNALLSLNACPMSQVKEKYVLRRIAPITSDENLHLPLPLDASIEEISSLNPMDVQLEQKSADPNLVNLSASSLKSTFQLAYKLLTEIVQITGWEQLLKYRSKIFVMEDEYQGSTSSIDEAEVRGNDISKMRSKRLCERWLDNLFMLLYEDLKTYTDWQSEQLYFDAQNSKYHKLTVEWELFGLCAKRLGHLPEAAKAFQIGLSQRFSPVCAKNLLQFYIDGHKRIRRDSVSANSELTSSQILSSINDIDSSIIDLVVKICCWNHRWYIEFSIILIDALSVAVQDMGITKVHNEIASRFSDPVAQLIDDNILNFLKNFTNDTFDN
ncbi:Bch1p [Saccharomyces cerevisiae YJM1356]|nr:Bch1p [Saccharomyces cerevisiae YJM1356]